MPLDHYVTLGRSGLRVSPFCLGCMTFGDEWAAVGTHEEESLQVLEAYLEAGGNFLDTANMYTMGHSEAIIGDYFAGSPMRARDRVVIATKFSGNLHPGDPNGGGAGRKAIIHQAEDAATPAHRHIDLTGATSRPNTPIDDDAGVRPARPDGKVRHIGFSDMPARRCRRSTKRSSAVGSRSSRCRSSTASPSGRSRPTSCRWRGRSVWA